MSRIGVKLTPVYPKGTTSYFYSTCFHYLKIHINFSYYLLLTPFKLVYKPSANFYVIHTNIIQKILSSLLILLVCVQSILSIRLGFGSGKLRDNPSSLFKIAGILTNCSYSLVRVYTFWKSKKFLQNILQICQNENIIQHFRFKNTALAVALTIAAVLFTITFTLTTVFVLYASTWMYFKSIAGQTLYIFYIKSNLAVPRDQEMNIPLTIATVVCLILELQWRLLINFSVLFVLTIAITMYHLGLEFMNKLPTHDSNELEDSSSMDEVITTYAKVKDLMGNLNSFAGPTTVAFVLEAIPYFAEKTIVLLEKDTSLVWKAHILYSFMYYYIILLVAAEAHSKFCGLREWLFKMGMGIVQKEGNPRFSFIFLEVSTHQLGLQGGGFFTISYEYLASITTLFITYTLIVVQFKSPYPPSIEL